MIRWRQDRSDIRLYNSIRLLRAVRQLANDPTITMADLFDLDPDSPVYAELWDEPI